MKSKYSKAPAKQTSLLVLIIIFVACVAQDLYKQLLSDATVRFPILSGYQWTIKSAWTNTKGVKTFEAEAERSDTTFAITIGGIPRKSSNGTDSIVLHAFLKTYRYQDSVYVQSINQNGHDIYLYRFSEANSDELDFIFGYYLFLYERGGMKPLQREFYLLNKDSLDRLRGGSIRPTSTIRPEQFGW